jgi:hypothetical protein
MIKDTVRMSNTVPNGTGWFKFLPNHTRPYYTRAVIELIELNESSNSQIISSTHE